MTKFLASVWSKTISSCAATKFERICSPALETSVAANDTPEAKTMPVNANNARVFILVFHLHTQQRSSLRDLASNRGGAVIAYF